MYGTSAGCALLLAPCWLVECCTVSCKGASAAALGASHRVATLRLSLKRAGPAEQQAGAVGPSSQLAYQRPVALYVTCS